MGTSKNTGNNRKTGRSTGNTAASAKTGGRGASSRGQNYNVTVPAKKQSGVRDEIVLIVSALVCVLMILSYFGICGGLGKVINLISFGLFGVMAYVLPICIFVLAAYRVNSRGKANVTKQILEILLLLLFIASLTELICENDYENFGLFAHFTNSQLADTFEGVAGNKAAFDGLLGGLFTWTFESIAGRVAAIIIVVGLLLIDLVLLTHKMFLTYLSGSVKNIRKPGRNGDGYDEEEDETEEPVRNRGRRQTAENNVQAYEEEREKRHHGFKAFREDDVDLSLDALIPDEDYEPEKIRLLRKNGKKVERKDSSARSAAPERQEGSFVERLKAGGSSVNSGQSYSDEALDSIFNETATADAAESNAGQENQNVGFSAGQENRNSGFSGQSEAEFIESEINKRFGENTSGEGENRGKVIHLSNRQNYNGRFIADPDEFETPDSASKYSRNGKTNEDNKIGNTYHGYVHSENDNAGSESFGGNTVDDNYSEGDDSEENNVGEENNTGEESNTGEKKNASRASSRSLVGGSSGNGGAAAEAAPIEIKEAELKEEYMFPPLELLGKAKSGKQGVSERELADTANKLQETLESFGVGVTVSNVSCGPTVTRYELLPDHGVKVSRITSLADDIKLNLAAKDIRIEAPIPGKAAIGIEVPNSESVPVLLRDIIESEEYKNSKSDIAVGIGRDVYGKPVIANIEQMPHLLVAGATGSGKSVCINTIIVSLLYRAKPSDVKLILIDPKIVELSNYNGIPHLMLPVITDPQKAAAALNWAVAEMDRRYGLFAEQGVRDLVQYNYKVEENKYNDDDENSAAIEKMPRLVVIVDELADLMMTGNGKEVENMIVRLTQKARAAGIHLILATQRPTVNVITGLIKANVPARIAFSVASALDSRTILDSMGAESLLGKGDMLFLMTGQPKAVRLQGAFISDSEINAVCGFLKEQVAKIGKHEEIQKQQESQASVITAPALPGSDKKSDPDRDDLFEKVGRFIIEKDKASVGMLQRFFSIGYNRAARIMDQLCDAGVVGPEEIKKPRKILMTAEQFEEYLKTH